MKIDTKTIFLTIVLVLVAVVGLYFQLGQATPPSKTVHTDREDGERHNMLEKIKVRRQRGVEKARLRRQAATHASERPKPNILRVEDPEEKQLNEFSRKVLREIQEALDREDFATVSRLVTKMLERPPDEAFGSAGVNRILRRRAVEALGWFGAQALPELTGMLADSDPEIVQQTFDQFSLALEDISLSDYERADIVVMAAKTLTDPEHLEMLLMEINNMRHSVGAGALVEICLNGTEPAKTLMPDSIEFFTGEDNIKTVEDMENWLKENPDGSDDDDLYGGDTEA